MERKKELLRIVWHEKRLEERTIAAWIPSYCLYLDYCNVAAPEVLCDA